jgi:hypothetical protein
MQLIGIFLCYSKTPFRVVNNHNDFQYRSEKISLFEHKFVMFTLRFPVAQ